MKGSLSQANKCRADGFAGPRTACLVFTIACMTERSGGHSPHTCFISFNFMKHPYPQYLTQIFLPHIKSSLGTGKQIVVARFKVRVRCRSLAGIASWNPAGGMDLLLSVLCCQVEVSALGLSHVQRSPTECGVSEYDYEASILGRPWPSRIFCAIRGNFLSKLLLPSGTKLILEW